jgi:hypothetical protein
LIEGTRIIEIKLENRPRPFLVVHDGVQIAEIGALVRRLVADAVGSCILDNVHFLYIVVLRKVVYLAERRGARLLIDWYDGMPEQGIDKGRLAGI